MTAIVKILSPRVLTPSPQSPVTESSRSLKDVFKNGTESEGLLVLESPLALTAIPTASEPNGITWLHLAAKKGWAKICQVLLESNNYDVNVQDERGWSPLHFAVVYHRLRVVSLLLDDFKADLALPDKQGNTPIHLACYHGHQEIVEYFLKTDRLDLTRVNADGDTPFHLACSMFLYMTSFLISKGKVDLNALKNDSRSPVQVACLSGRWEVAVTLVKEHGFAPTGTDHYGNTLAHELSRIGQRDVLRIIVSSSSGSIDLSCRNADGDTPLHVACRHAQSCVVKFLVTQKGVDPDCHNSQGFTPVEVACRRSHWKIGLKLILENGCRPLGRDTEGNTSLHGACMTNNAEAVRHIVNIGSVSHTSQNKKSDTPLHIACYNGNMDIVQFLVSLHDSRPHCRNMAGDTPLHFASMAGHADVIKFLLTVPGVDHRSLNTSANTPLHLACEYGHTEAARTLVTASEDVDHLIGLKNNQGKTPAEVAFACQKWSTAIYMATLSESYVPNVERHMHLFCAEGYFDLIQTVLTTLTVDVNCRDRFKNTPLHHACKAGALDVIQYLLFTAKADPTCINELQNAPIHTASLEGHADAVRYLMSIRTVDPNCVNKALDTPLHMACSRQHHKVISFLLKSGRVNPFQTNKDGKTPLEILKSNRNPSPELVGLFDSLKESMAQYPVDTYTKVFLCGDSGSGKSSLAKVLSDRSMNRRRFSRGVLGKKFVAGVRFNTQGMESWDIRTPENDNMMLYDLSGHPAYHASHIAYLRCLNRSFPSVFVTAVDVRSPEEEIRRQLQYWRDFAISTCNPSARKSMLLVIGSHVDSLEKRDLNRIKTLVDEIMTSQKEEDCCTYAGFHFLNCSKLHSKRLTPFFNILSETCQSLNKSDQSSSFVSPCCHALYNFLLNKLKEKAITMVNLVYRITSDDSCLIPSQTYVLEQLLTYLRDRGLINLIKCSHHTWIIIDSQYITRDVIGSILAPPDHPTQVKSATVHASSTGIVSVEVLEEVFCQLPAHALVGVLCGLELCYEVDVKTLTQTPNNLNTVESPDKKRKLFFPSFVTLEEPPPSDCKVGVGWCCLGSKSQPFLTPHLAHVILLRLLRTYCLPDSTHPLKNATPISSFEAWQAGVRWVTIGGAEATVKLSLAHQSIVIVLSYSEETRFEHLRLRSALFASVQSALCEFLPVFDVKEWLVPSSQLVSLSQEQFDKVELYNIDEVATAALSGHTSVSITDNRTAQLIDLLHDDPYLHLSMECYQALHEAPRFSQEVPESFLEEIRSRCGDKMMSGCTGRTYQAVRDHLDEYSVLARLGIGGLDNPRKRTVQCLLYEDSDRPFLVEKLKGVENWMLLGKLLGLNEDFLQGLEMAKVTHEEAIRSLLSVWLDRGPEHSLPAREVLINALETMKELEIMESL